MSKFLFVLSRGPEDPTRAGRCFQLAKVAAEKGHETVVFLVDDAVYLTNMQLAERVKNPTGDEVVAHLKVLLDKGGKVYVCKPCAEVRNIIEDDLPAGFAIGTAMLLIDLAEQSKTISF